MLSIFVSLVTLTLPVSANPAKFQPLVFNARYLWPNGAQDIPYDIITAAYPPSYQQIILNAVQHIADKTCITFKPRTSERSYLQFTQNSAGTCLAQVGYAEGPVPITLDPVGCGFGAVVHEIGHSLGLLHTMARKDRDRYIYVNRSAIPVNNHDYDKMDNSSCQPPTCNPDVFLDVNAYDYGSIMHYSSRESQIIYGPRSTGQLNGLSHWDVAELDFMYTGCQVNTLRCLHDIPQDATVGVGQQFEAHFFVNLQSIPSTTTTTVNANFYSSIPADASVHNMPFVNGSTVNPPLDVLTLVFTPSASDVGRFVEVGAVFSSSVASSVVCTSRVMVLGYAVGVQCFGWTPDDPQVCSGHGRCVVSDTCLCDDGWTGLQCNANASIPNAGLYQAYTSGNPYVGPMLTVDRTTNITLPWQISLQWENVLEFELVAVTVSVSVQQASTVLLHVLRPDMSTIASHAIQLPANSQPTTRALVITATNSAFGNVGASGYIRMEIPVPGLWFPVPRPSLGPFGFDQTTRAFTLWGVVRCRDGFFGERCEGLCPGMSPGAAPYTQCFQNGMCNDGTSGAGVCVQCRTNYDPATGCATCVPRWGGKDCIVPLNISSSPSPSLSPSPRPSPSPPKPSPLYTGEIQVPLPQPNPSPDTESPLPFQNTTGTIVTPLSRWFQDNLKITLADHWIILSLVAIGLGASCCCLFVLCCICGRCRPSPHRKRTSDMTMV